MPQRRNNFKRTKKLPPIPPSVTSGQRWWDRLKIASWLVLPPGAILAVMILGARAQWERSIDNRLTAWQQAYHLSDATVVRLRQIELDFHGSGNPFTSPIRRSPAEVKTHSEEMVALMEPEVGMQFLRDMRQGRWKH